MSEVCRMTTREKNREIRHAMYSSSAKKAIGDIDKGIDLHCLTKGQFSIINVIEHVVREIGECDVIISTWTAAKYDITKIFKLKENKNIRNIDFILDRSAKTKVGGDNFKTFDELFCGHVHLTNTHAKFILIRNDNFNIVIETSMNLNENKRIEMVKILDSKKLYDYYISVCCEIIGVDFTYTGFNAICKGEEFRKYENRSSTKIQLET